MTTKRKQLVDSIQAPRVAPRRRVKRAPQKVIHSVAVPTGTSEISFGKIGRLFVVSKISLLLLLLICVVPLAAFEAHVVNVTAQIERSPEEPPPQSCMPRSPGYWANHEGCNQGSGTSTWAGFVNNLSINIFSGLFATTTGESVCTALWTPNCPSGNNVPAALCRAKRHTLADELNIVSGKLALNAFIAGADDGNNAFDFLGLSPTSTVEQALDAIELVLVNTSSTKNEIDKAGHVAERIYVFYENENPFSPQCIFDPNLIPQCLLPGVVITENNNSSTVVNNIETETNTGDNSASESSSTVATGDASSTSVIENDVNTNIVTIGGESSTTASSTATEALQSLKGKIKSLKESGSETTIPTAVIEPATSAPTSTEPEPSNTATTTEAAPAPAEPSVEVPSEPVEEASESGA